MTRTTPLRPSLRPGARGRRRPVARHLEAAEPRDAAVLGALEMWSAVRAPSGVTRW